MKLASVSKLDERKTATSKKLGKTSCQNYDVIVIFEFLANLEQSRSRISDAWSVKFIFSLTVTLHLTKTEN